jgi:hypothetical protein
MRKGIDIKECRPYVKETHFHKKGKLFDGKVKKYKLD